MSAVALTPSEWAAIMRNPLLDKRYQSTGLGAAVSEYLARREIAGLAARTLDQYERDLARLCILHADKTPGQVTTRDLEEVIGTFPAGSRRRVRAAIRAFFDHLYANEQITSDPARRLPAIKQERQRLIDIFTDSEQDKLKHLPVHQRDRVLMRILLETGIRKSEATALTLADFDLDGGALSIRRGKGNKGRVIPMPDSTTAAVLELAHDEGLDRKHYLWYTRYVNETTETIQRGRRLGPGGFHRWWGRTLDEAEVRYRNPHTTRHTYATLLLRRGAPMQSVSRLLGHSSVRTTIDVYAHLAVEDLAIDVARAFAPKEV